MNAETALTTLTDNDLVVVKNIFIQGGFIIARNTDVIFEGSIKEVEAFIRGLIQFPKMAGNKHD